METEEPALPVLILNALIDAPLAWQTPAQIATAIGDTLDVVEDALTDLELAGWVVGWEEWPQGLAVTFTPLGASRLSLRICEEGPYETPRWYVSGRPDPEPAKVKRVFRSDDALDHVVDPAFGPAELAEIAEEQARQVESRARSKGASPQNRRRAHQSALDAKRRRQGKRRARGHARPETRASH